MTNAGDRRLPTDVIVLAPVQRNVGFRRDTIATRPTPARPFLRGQRNRAQQAHEEGQDGSHRHRLAPELSEKVAHHGERTIRRENTKFSLPYYPGMKDAQ